ncbi:hypothetical protein I7I50_06176 [Histoplasma capsulatum G186AR]|uniref:Uncharacterized protein n=1 Tax=Ajellomyces capsulatus TaxID=5037 RepID=A0A8H7Z301_AJECA|nr:hypothetical protein I7I52_10746 [Histoplasma capsulatum]QSS67175.1 hypothetical protein I7I50_06176 [Histoplasma capsulatum G186AR]
MFFSAWISINTWEMLTSFHNDKVDIFYLLVMITRNATFRLPEQPDFSPFSTVVLHSTNFSFAIFFFLKVFTSDVRMA